MYIRNDEIKNEKRGGVSENNNKMDFEGNRHVIFKEGKGMTQKKSILNYAAILSVFLFSGAGTFMNAAIQIMIEAWPQLSATTIRMVVSVPPLVSLPVMLVVGAIVGKKISYRTCSILGTLCIAVGGVGPFFLYSSWSVVLLLRAILGVGVGFIGMRNTLVTRSVPPEKAAAYIGYGAVLYNLGNVLANPIVGALAAKNWRFSFLYDAVAFIPLILIILFLKEPAEVQASESANPKDSTVVSGGKISWRIYYYMLLQFLTCCTLYPLLSCMATYIDAKKLGSAAIAGTILSSYTLAGAVVNLLIEPLHKFFKRYTISVLCLFVVAGEALVIFMPSIPTLFIGCVLSGIGFSAVITIFQIYNGQEAPAHRVAFTSTLILAMLQLAIFASNYFIVGCHAVFQRATDAESAFVGGMVVYLVLAVCSAVLKVKPEEK